MRWTLSRSTRASFTSVKDPDYFKPQIEEMHATEVGGFNAELEAEMCKLEECDLMIWQFPLWWFGLPAVLKGWVDCVFAMGRFTAAGASTRPGQEGQARHPLAHNRRPAVGI